jgi:predicted RNA-binding protein YlxR (DUF448 family)
VGERGGRRDRSPRRRCILTGEVKDPAALVRFVISPEGRVTPDLAGKLPGRGLWLSASAAAVEEAARRGRFAHAARASVTADADLAERVGAGLAERCLSYLGLARRSGAVVTGFENVAEALRAGRVTMLIAAADGAPASRRRLQSLAGGDRPVELFSRAELSLALGRENVVHAALSPGRISACFASEAARLAGFRDDPGGAPGVERTKSVREQSHCDE